MTTLKERRNAAGMSQAKLAFAMGVTPAVISRWESGKVEPIRMYRQKMAAILGGYEGDYKRATQEVEKS